MRQAMTKRTYEILAVALLAIAPIFAACHGGGGSPTEPIEPPPAPPPPASRNAILGRGQGTVFPDCIPIGPSQPNLFVGYDALEAASFSLVFLHETGFVWGSYIEVTGGGVAPPQAGGTTSFRVWAFFPPTQGVVNRIEIHMLSADGTRLLNADPNPRVFRHLDIPIGPQNGFPDCT